MIFTYRDYSGRYLQNNVDERTSTDYIAVHYDAIPGATSPDNIQRQHHDINGWESGIAYHFFLMGGKVYQCRPIGSQSPHAPGYNWNCVAVCIHAPDRYNIRDRLNMWLLISALKVKYKLNRERIVGHRELPGNNTECPAMNMDSLRRTFF